MAYNYQPFLPLNIPLPSLLPAAFFSFALTMLDIEDTLSIISSNDDETDPHTRIQTWLTHQCSLPLTALEDEHPEPCIPSSVSQQSGLRADSPLLGFPLLSDISEAIARITHEYVQDTHTASRDFKFCTPTAVIHTSSLPPSSATITLTFPQWFYFHWTSASFSLAFNNYFSRSRA
ncbi:hypothetical protein BDN72DRAFT_675604 [Pluteus cervinus]|uniref:Uncharacterized protein n=1 Tax=Pluteus cervinus TaxID=181527 RepID=A0ACD3ARI3_9AGAR|nr:hypothetical protein BDN72DRAFT_675604 [Pluteus cervinus]